MLRFLGRYPGVVDIDLAVVVLEFGHDIYHAGIAQVGAVFLEDEAMTRTLVPSTFMRRFIMDLMNCEMT